MVKYWSPCFMKHSQILNSLFHEGSCKVTVDVNRTRNLPITRLTPYPLGHQAIFFMSTDSMSIHFPFRINMNGKNYIWIYLACLEGIFVLDPPACRTKCQWFKFHWKQHWLLHIWENVRHQTDYASFLKHLPDLIFLLDVVNSINE